MIGRNFTHQTISQAIGFFDKDKFIASGAIGRCIDEFNGDNFDHAPYGMRRALAHAFLPVLHFAGLENVVAVSD